MTTKEPPATNGSMATAKPPAPATGYPLPVPANMRTSLRRPRTIASIITVLWLLTFVVGTTALARHQLQVRSPLDNFFLVGSNHWGIYHSSDTKRCIGYVSADMESKETPTFKLDGLFQFRMDTVNVPVALSIDALFTNFLKLDTMTASAKLGKAKISIETAPDSVESLLVDISTPSLNKQMKVARPEPVYLVKRGATAFNLKLPPNYEQLISQSQDSTPDWEKLTGYSFAEINEHDFKQCKTQSATVPHETLDQLLDVANFMRLLSLGNLQFDLNRLKEAAS